MPRTSRKLSKTGIYHVILRGNERKEIFLNDEDRKRFIEILREKKEDKEYSVLAYCLMDNHVHLLIKEGNDQINRVMKRIGVSYVYYFNKAYKRIGHLFQDRFKSEPISGERYLLAAVRYIHNNPVKAKIVKEPVDYHWSSYNAYVSRNKSDRDLIDSDLILKIFSENEEQAIDQLIDFSKEQANDEFIDIKEEDILEKPIKNEYEALMYIEQTLREKGYRGKGKAWTENTGIRNDIIKSLKEKTTLSTREIAAILGINRNTVQRA